ncbi:MAG: type II toxin-antitoxin system HicB family antitoxin [bacterium]
MPIHIEVLDAAVRICRERHSWIFSPEEIVRALPQLNPHSVRTHVVSRCCVNAPKNHPHKWDYFRRLGRGRYEILPAHRRRPRARHPIHPPPGRVAEARTPYSSQGAPRGRDTVHAFVHRDNEAYVAECLEVAVVTQGRTLDELVANLGDALALHLEGEEATLLGVAPNPRLVLTYETPLALDVAGR